MVERIVTAKIHVYTVSELTDLEKKLIEAARSASNKAYAPYSAFQVGAAVLLENGEIITGNNQENAAYPSGLCAERVALFFANAQFPDIRVKMMALTAQTKGNFIIQPIAPCGSCRQVILETEHRFDSPIRILMAGQNEAYVVDSIKDLLPLYFDRNNLKND